MNFSIEKSFVIPEIWINILSFCSYQEIFDIFKFLYLYQKYSKEDLNINLLARAYVLNKINSDKLNSTIYKVFKHIKYSYKKPSIKYHMKYYTSIYTYSLKYNFEKSIYSYLLKEKLSTILYNDGVTYTKKTSKHKIFNQILQYLNKQYQILFKITLSNNEFNDFKISSVCYKNNCSDEKLCNDCIQNVYWKKLLNILGDNVC
mgnify:CR=1 FL=1